MKTDIKLKARFNNDGKIILQDTAQKNTSIEKTLRQRYKLKDGNVYVRIRLEETREKLSQEELDKKLAIRQTVTMTSSGSKALIVATIEGPYRYVGIIDDTRPGLWDAEGNPYDQNENDILMTVKSRTIDFIYTQRDSAGIIFIDRQGNEIDPEKQLEETLREVGKDTQYETEIRLTADDKRHKEIPFDIKEAGKLIVNRKKGKMTDAAYLPVNVYSTNAKGDYPIMGKLYDKTPMFWSKEGKASDGNPEHDLKIHLTC